MTRRFIIRDGYIEDRLTGRVYRTPRELCKLLNQVNARADSNAEKYFNLLYTKKDPEWKSVDSNCNGWTYYKK